MRETLTYRTAEEELFEELFDMFRKAYRTMDKADNAVRHVPKGMSNHR